MESSDLILGTTSLLIIGISLIPFILLCVIAYRLKLLINTTFKSSRIPGVSHYAEARAYEEVGDKVNAKRCYYLAYWALRELGYKSFGWYGENVKVQDIEQRIETI